jgi:hypothetical protein
MSLSGFRNSSPMSWFFSPSLSYPFFTGLSTFFFAYFFFGYFVVFSYFCYFSFFFACFFLKWPWIVVAACSISLSGFKNSSPISWFFSSSRLYPFPCFLAFLGVLVLFPAFLGVLVLFSAFYFLGVLVL